MTVMLVVTNNAHADFTGKVIVVMDGDTIMVLNQRQKVRVRLQGIDAPEQGQAYGAQAKTALKNLIWHHQVSITTNGLDQYGRTLGWVYDKEVNINAIQIAQGWAWVYRQYHQDADLIALENSAKTHKIGLWQDVEPTPPWVWRHLKPEYKQPQYQYTK